MSGPKPSPPVILCVDDEQFVLNALNSQLQRRFGGAYEYEFAESAEEATELIQELCEQGHEIVMVISDQIMPGMTGDEFLIDVHEKHPKPIKILLTGQAAIESAMKAINNANLYRYLTKPWDEKDFLLTVEKGIREYELMEEVRKQIEVFQRFVPKDFLEHLGKASILDIELGDQVHKEMTVLFSDIRAFTTLSEKMSPKDNFNFLNSYLRHIGPIIPKNHGFIDNFIGDAIMALFPHRVDDALQAAIEMHRGVLSFNQRRRGYGLEEIAIGIGLHAGNLMLGTIGNEQRMQGTVISDAVNLASRLEGLTKHWGTNIAVSEETVTKLEHPEQFEVRLMGRVKVKGKQKSVSVYEVLDVELHVSAALKVATREDFEKGLIQYYQKDFTGASVLFNKVLKENPGDKVARIYLERSAKFMVDEVPNDWTGIVFKSD